MPIIANRVKMNTATIGTGSPLTLNAAILGYQTFAAAGITNGQVVDYVIEDTGGIWEIGTGTYTSAGTTLSRTVIESSSGGSPISLTGAAVVMISPYAADYRIETLMFALSDELSNLTTGTAKVQCHILGRQFNLVTTHFGLNAVSTSGIVQFDINKNGSTIYSTMPTIDVNVDTTLTAATPSVLLVNPTPLVSGDKLSFDIDVIGTNMKGAKAHLLGYWVN